MKFTCPKCKEHRIEEIMINVTVASEVLDVDKDGDVNYGEQSNEDGEVDRYQCMICGWTIESDHWEPKNSEQLYGCLNELNNPSNRNGF